MKLFSGVLNSSSDIRDVFHRHARSLDSNNLGPEGAEHIGAALKENTALETLECVALQPPSRAPSCSAGVLNSSADVRFVFHRHARSLTGNGLGPEGAAHIGAALKENHTLTELRCVALRPWRCRFACSAGC